uniref:Uncharacterized protein n=1 Tax=Anguilla anguilla TaxID=7936 RepID=A0A0E9WG46_ANGAN
MVMCYFTRVPRPRIQPGFPFVDWTHSHKFHPSPFQHPFHSLVFFN